MPSPALPEKRWSIDLEKSIQEAHYADNALYFGKQASANYAVHFMLDLLGKDELIKKHIEQRTSWTTGYEVMSWKDACGVPQRGS